MDASEMNMVFFSSLHTPLFSSQWTPTSSGSYAGTCIFLIIFAFLFRGTFFLKSYYERRWAIAALNRRYVVVADKTPAVERVSRDSASLDAVLFANGVEEAVRVVQQRVWVTQPFRFSVDLPRAVLATLIAGIGYLLMLAVMTLNVGYFLSVLAGTFIGELAFGRYYKDVETHH